MDEIGPTFNKGQVQMFEKIQGKIDQQTATLSFWGMDEKHEETNCERTNQPQYHHILMNL